MWVFELPEEDKMQALKNMMADEVFRLVKGFYSANSLPINGPDSTTVATGPVQGPQPPPLTQPKKNTQDNNGGNDEENAPKEEEGKQEEVQDPFTVWQGDEIRVCDDLLYVLRMSNPTADAMTFRVEFSSQDGDGDVNLIWPREGLYGSIKANEVNKVIAVMPKIRASSSDSASMSEIQKLRVTLTAQKDQNQKDENAAAQNGANENAAGGDNN